MYFNEQNANDLSHRVFDQEKNYRIQSNKKLFTPT